MAMKFRIAFLALVLVGFVDCYGSGPPVGTKPEICDTMLPGHNGLDTQNATSPYDISVENGVTTYTPGKSVAVTIGGSVNFQGFMLLARKMSTNITVGTFSPPPPNTQLLQCGQTSNNVVGHSNINVKNNLEFTWNPPNEDNGHVEFVATIAQEKLIVWVQQRSTIHLSFVPGAGMSLHGVSMVLLACTAFVARIFASV